MLCCIEIHSVAYVISLMRTPKGIPITKTTRYPIWSKCHRTKTLLTNFLHKHQAGLRKVAFWLRHAWKNSYGEKNTRLYSVVCLEKKNSQDINQDTQHTIERRERIRSNVRNMIGLAPPSSLLFVIKITNVSRRKKDTVYLCVDTISCYASIRQDCYGMKYTHISSSKHASTDKTFLLLFFFFRWFWSCAQANHL